MTAVFIVLSNIENHRMLIDVHSSSTSQHHTGAGRALREAGGSGLRHGSRWLIKHTLAMSN